jgi:hypothetical protein
VKVPSFVADEPLGEGVVGIPADVQVSLVISTDNQGAAVGAIHCTGGDCLHDFHISSLD